MLKVIWKDPVWAAVIATGITAAFGTLGAYLLGYWPALQSAAAGIWLFLFANTQVSNWVLVLLAIPSTLAGILLLAVLWSLWPGKKDSESNWSIYTMDTFFGLRWRWRYDAGAINRLVTFCPHCDYQVFPMKANSFDVVDRIEYKCDSCHQHLGIFDESYAHLESKVQRFIQQKIRTGTWKAAS